MGFDRLEAFTADHMLDPAGILDRRLLGNAEANEELGQGRVPLEYSLGYRTTRREQVNRAVRVHRYVSVRLEIFHRDADRRLRKAELGRDIDRSNAPAALFKYKYRFEIILGGSLNFHCRCPLCV